MQLFDLTDTYGAGNEPTSIDQIPDFIKNQYHDYNTGSLEYLNWKVRDVWDNCKQTKNVIAVDLSTLSIEYSPNENRFYSTSLQSFIKKTIIK